MFSWCEPFISWLTPPTFYRLYRFIFCNQQASLCRGNVSFDQPGLGTLRYGGPVYQVGGPIYGFYLTGPRVYFAGATLPPSLPGEAGEGDGEGCSGQIDSRSGQVV